MVAFRFYAFALLLVACSSICVEVGAERPEECWDSRHPENVGYCDACEGEFSQHGQLKSCYNVAFSEHNFFDNGYPTTAAEYIWYNVKSVVAFGMNCVSPFRHSKLLGLGAPAWTSCMFAKAQVIAGFIAANKTPKEGWRNPQILQSPCRTVCIEATYNILAEHVNKVGGAIDERLDIVRDPSTLLDDCENECKAVLKAGHPKSCMSAAVKWGHKELGIYTGCAAGKAISSL